MCRAMRKNVGSDKKKKKRKKKRILYILIGVEGKIIKYKRTDVHNKMFLCVCTNDICNGIYIAVYAPGRYSYLCGMETFSRNEQIFANYHVRRPIKSDVQRSLQVALNSACICMIMASVYIRYARRDSAPALYVYVIGRV